MTGDPTRVDLDELAALEEQRTFLLTSLDDLDREHEAGDLDDADYATLHADYTARAARVIEAIDEHHEVIDSGDRSRSGARRLLVVFAVVVVAAVAGLVVTTVSGTDRETTTGTGVLEPSDATRACIEAMQAALAPAEGDEPGSAVEVLECFTERIEADPTDAVAFTYRGRTLALLAGQLEGIAGEDDVRSFAARSRSDLDEALELAPDYVDALVFAAMGALSDGDVAGAREYVARIDRLQLPANDPMLPIVNNALRPALNEAATGPTTTAPTTTVP